MIALTTLLQRAATLVLIWQAYERNDPPRVVETRPKAPVRLNWLAYLDMASPPLWISVDAPAIAPEKFLSNTPSHFNQPLLLRLTSKVSYVISVVFCIEKARNTHRSA